MRLGKERQPYFLNGGHANQWFIDHASDYTTLFPTFTDEFLGAIQHNTVEITRMVNPDGTDAFVFTDNGIAADKITGDDVYFALSLED